MTVADAHHPSHHYVTPDCPDCVLGLTLRWSSPWGLRLAYRACGPPSQAKPSSTSIRILKTVRARTKRQRHLNTRRTSQYAAVPSAPSAAFMVSRGLGPARPARPPACPSAARSSRGKGLRGQREASVCLLFTRIFSFQIVCD